MSQGEKLFHWFKLCIHNLVRTLFDLKVSHIYGIYPSVVVWLAFVAWPIAVCPNHQQPPGEVVYLQ